MIMETEIKAPCFLRAAEGKEIINIVSKCKSKMSSDCNGIDMTPVKKKSLMKV